MLLIAKLLANLFSILNSEESPRQIAAGFAAGALLGLIPVGYMVTIVGFLIMIVNVNLTMVGASALVFKLGSYLLDPLLHRTGAAVLTAPSLREFWTKMYNTPLVPYTRFNNTVVMGSVVVGLLGLIPLYFLGVWLVSQYRVRWKTAILKWKIVKVLESSKFYKYYLSFRGIVGS